jgi:NAD(P)-dependent dehydrogenase (short-subunit alcohol dehydrogenase family)
MQQIRFENQVAIVTGAGGGLGRAYALALARRGARVIVNDLGGSLRGEGAAPEIAQAVVDEIKAAGGEAVADVHNVADEHAARAMVEKALDTFGSLDAIICNAGISQQAPFDAISMDDFKRVVGVHLWGTAGLVHAAWPRMKAKGYGRIVMTSSAAAMWGVHEVSGYCAGKGAIIGLAKCLALEGEPLGIKVNVVAPGAKTRMSAHLFEGRRGWTWRPEVVEPLVTYLASSACRHNGAVFSGLGGTFARVESMQAIGKSFDPRLEIQAEDVLAHLDEIDDMTGARSFVKGRDVGTSAVGYTG